MKNSMRTEYSNKYAGPGKDEREGHMTWLPHHPRIVAFFFIFHISVKQDAGVMSSDKTTYDNVYNVITDDKLASDFSRFTRISPCHCWPEISRTARRRLRLMT